jgi:deazaflavin-dependent oxidoreductase (nitroreductase family)
MGHDTKSNMPPKIWRTFNKLQNPFMKRLLRSPFHIFVSKMYMLITFTGRKSGTVYTTPVQYKRDGNTVYVVTSQGYTWWKNLRGGANVKLVIQGKSYAGHANITEDTAQIINHLGKIYPKLNPEKRMAFAQGKVAITIDLS